MAEFNQISTSKIQNNKPQERQVEAYKVVANPVSIREEVIAKSNNNMQLLIQTLKAGADLSKEVIQKTETENTKNAVNKMFEIENSGKQITEEDYKQIEKDTGIFINSNKVEDAYRDITSNRMLTDGKKVLSELKEKEWDNSQETQDRFGGDFSSFYNTKVQELKDGYKEEFAGTKDPKFVFDYVNKFNQLAENNYNNNIKPIEEKRKKEELQLTLKENFNNILDVVDYNNIDKTYKTFENNINNVKTAIGSKYSTIVPEFVNSLLIKAEETGNVKVFEIAKKMNIEGHNVYETNREAFLKAEMKVNNTKTERNIVEQNIYDKRVEESLLDSISKTNYNEEDYKRVLNNKYESEGKKISNTILNKVSDTFEEVKINNTTNNIFTGILNDKLNYADLQSSLNVSDNNLDKRKKVLNKIDNTYNLKQDEFYKNNDISNMTYLNRQFGDKEIESYSILNDFKTLTNIKDTELNNIDPKELDNTINKLNSLDKSGIKVKGVDSEFLSVLDSEAFQKTPLEQKPKALSNLTKYKENKEFKNIIDEEIKEDIKGIYNNSDIPSSLKDSYAIEYKNHFIITGLKQEYKEKIKKIENKTKEINGKLMEIGMDKVLFDKYSEVNDDTEMIYPLDPKKGIYIIINKKKFDEDKVVIPYSNKLYYKNDLAIRHNQLKKTENTTLGTVVDTSRDLGGFVYDIFNPQEKPLTPEEIKRKQEMKKIIDSTEEQIKF